MSEGSESAVTGICETVEYGLKVLKLWVLAGDEVDAEDVEAHLRRRGRRQ